MELLPDQLDLLLVFLAHGVRFLIIGGHAVNIYTEPRFTNDMDVLVGGDEANGLRVFSALAAFGAPLAGMTPQDFINKPQLCYQIGVQPARVDILQSIPAVDFEESWQRASLVNISGHPIRFISRDDLLRNKLAAGRHKDLADAEELRKFTKGSNL